MRLVFVNYCHPDTPHICGVRVAQFARAMAARGHQVVLVTRDLDGHPVAPPPSALPDLLAGHDWRHPLHLAVAPRPSRFFTALQEGTLPAGLRQAAILAAYLGAGGLFADWGCAAQATARALGRHFRPDVAWGTFGNTDTWQVARAVGVPWVGDIKDYWAAFIPAPLRKVLARRFADASALTLLAGTHVEEARPFFAQAATVIYSGLPAYCLAGEPQAPETFTLMLSGSLYGQDVLDRFLGVLAGRRGRLVYAGADHGRLRGLHLPGWEVEIHPYLPLEELAALQRRVTANAYIRSPRCFHHKVIELLAMRRPVIAFPGESDEAKAIARTTGGTLLACDGEAELAASLDRLEAAEVFPAASVQALSAYGWDAQAAVLEQVFTCVLERKA